MHVIKARNVNGALNKGLMELVNHGVENDSRNGQVIRFPWPVTTVYDRPEERVLFSSVRDANPVFHLVESLWMLAGRNDVAFPATFVKRMREFSDDGVTFNGAYGHRWRKHFGYDQIECIVNLLKRDPGTRRAVLTMWDAQSIHDIETLEPGADLHKTALGQAKDVPCNTQIYFNASGKVLNMTICCRSNDMIWGAYGANAVHMSVLHEYVARSAGMVQGRMYQISNDLHVYRKVGGTNQDMLNLAMNAYTEDHYRSGPITPAPLFTEEETQENFDHDVDVFFAAFDANGEFDQWRTQFFRFVVDPMVASWAAHKRGESNAARKYADCIGSGDWRLAMHGWLDRRAK